MRYNKYRLYKIFTTLASPLIKAYLYYRKFKGKEDKFRFNERFGKATIPRPEGDVIWFHGASVGEAISMLTMIDKVREAYPDKKLLVTTGTVTSADIMAKRLPKDVIHQYVPVDLLSSVRRFLDYWKPSAAFFFEAEFWPNLVMEARNRGVKMVLINGRVSDVAFKKWEPHTDLSCQMLEEFELCLGQTSEDERRLKIMGAKNTMYLGNIKFAGAPLKFDEEERKSMAAKIGNRPSWVIASTHTTEEEVVADFHREIAKKYPNLLTILAPRHPNRGDEVRRIIEDAGLRLAQRSKGEPLTEDTQVYIADTMGEMGLFFNLSKIVLMGFSLTPKANGGHNALEPAMSKAAVLNGPYYENFKDMFDRMIVANAVVVVRDIKEMPATIIDLLDNPDKLSELANRGYDFAMSESAVLDRVMEQVKRYI